MSIAGERTLAEYCVSEIEQMWVDADHLAITAFVQAMGKSLFRSPFRTL